MFPWAVHLLTNPRIVVADDVITARGHWDLLQLATSQGDSVVALGRYQDEFRFSDGQWQFSAVRVDFTYVGNLASGWGEEAPGSWNDDRDEP
ncbi:nuclear transport factor 2 family protein [Microbacterium sp. NIBRBAC000506063]|uniref:nuclear transport factor 2 family protein n=1 Tax=Microbacterium sp. NIBRBAC000506063 TaxID=2734618 RepID=UPI001BB54F32|nr:nuclear transport factor 2 family protein [Microbacterium sp. NIBRBAC000506063]QTV80911.1 nuclear transport factor 2 family protein [Microbacterium sp. NIBRBAC000506063]